MIGYSDESIWLYLAEDLEKVNDPVETDETIEFYPTTFENALELVWSGKITDVKTIISILFLEKLRRKS